MQEKLDFFGAVVAHVVFISSIITFVSRMIFKLQPTPPAGRFAIECSGWGILKSKIRSERGG